VVSGIVVSAAVVSGAVVSGVVVSAAVVSTPVDGVDAEVVSVEPESDPEQAASPMARIIPSAEAPIVFCRFIEQTRLLGGLCLGSSVDSLVGVFVVLDVEREGVGGGVR
jgi:hypothetical protein